MGHDGYLVVAQQDVYIARTVSGVADMKEVVGRLMNPLVGVVDSYDGIGNSPYAHTDVRGVPRPPTDEEVRRIIRQEALKATLDNIRLNREKIPDGINVEIDPAARTLILSPYTTRWISEQSGSILIGLVQHEYSIIVPRRA